MEPFTQVTAVAAPIDIVNCDTDRILPARLLRKPRVPGYERWLFHDVRFDAQGRPHILFLDHGSEHFSQAGQIEYSGHIRHAVLQNGWQWQVESVFRQSDPMRNQMVYPAFAMNGSELVVTGLERATVWNMSAYPPTVSSNYRFRTVTLPLR